MAEMGKAESYPSLKAETYFFVHHRGTILKILGSKKKKTKKQVSRAVHFFLSKAINKNSSVFGKTTSHTFTWTERTPKVHTT